MYKILRQLAREGLIHKTAFNPVKFYAPHPIKDYNVYLKQIAQKLEKGADRLENLLKNSSSQSGETYLIKRDGGQQTLFLREDKKTIDDLKELRLIKQDLDQHIQQIEKQKLERCSMYRQLR